MVCSYDVRYRDSVLPMSRGPGACAVARDLGVGFCRHASSARRSVARFSRRVPRLRAPDRAAAGVVRRVSAPRAHDVAREDAGGPRRLAADDRPRSGSASARRRGPTATCTPASSRAARSRSRSPRTRCACTSSRDASICRRRSPTGCATCCSTSCRGSRPTAPSACCAPAASCARCRATSASIAARRAGSSATSTATASRSRCACRIPAASSSRRRASRACSSSARSRTRARSTRSIPRARSSTSTASASRSPYFLGDNPIDLNRNFPWSWAPTHEQVGAGPFATSEPESRGIVEFATAHPEIFAWCNFHTFGGVLIRPPGHAPDAKMDQEDLAMFRQLEAWMTEHTGYPTVAGYDEFLYEPDKPLQGRPHRVRVQPARRARVRDRAVGPVQAARHAAAAEVRRSTTSGSRATTSSSSRGGIATRTRAAAFPPWRAFDHPQLGEVEIGGIDPRVGIWNPPLHELATMCATPDAGVPARRRARAARRRSRRSTRTRSPAASTRVDVRVDQRRLPRHATACRRRRSSTSTSRCTRPRTRSGCELVDPGARAPDARPPRRLGPRPAHRREPAGVSGHARHDERGVGDATWCAATACSRCGSAVRARVRHDARRGVSGEGEAGAAGRWP